jgi:hypothetical protein
MDIKDQVEEINKRPFVSLEGAIEFDTSALPKIKKIMSRHKDFDSFLKDESLSNKMVIAKYLNTGKWEDEPISLTKIDDQTARNYGDMLLRDYAGIDTRGLIKVDLGIGAHVDEFALEKKIDKTFQAYLDPERQGSRMKAGRVFQALQRRPNRNNIVGLHPSNGSWANFLKDAELREENNGIKHYISSNGHYIVLPDGEVITFYGYHGQNAFNAIVEDKDGWLRERDKAEKEMDELLHPDIRKMGNDTGLTESQVEQAESEGVTTIAGLRRIEKNSRSRESEIRSKLKVGDDVMSWGITAVRAVELGEDPEYPRSDAAVFHFDKLTPEEQENVIRLKKLELEDAMKEQKNINIQQRESAKISRELNLRPGEMSPYPYKKKQAKERIANIESSIARLTLKASEGMMDKNKYDYLAKEGTKTSWSDKVYHEMGSPTLEQPYHLGKYDIVSWANHPRYGILVDVIDDSKVGLHFTRRPLDELIAETEPKGDTVKPSKDSDMYQAGYNNSVRFAYIPDFKTPQEKVDFDAGYKDGNEARELGRNRPIIEKSIYETDTTLQSIESSRSPLSQSSDERQEHSLILDADDPKVEKWKRDPGMADVRGIDTPKRGKKKTTKRRVSRPDTTMKSMRRR